MKELERLHLGVLNDEFLETSDVDQEEGNPREPVYGSDSACYYNCLAYAAKKFGWKCSPDKFAKDYCYGNMYKSIYEDDKWEGTGCRDEMYDGPYVGNNSFPPEPNPQAYNYMTNYFTTTDNHWARKSEDVKKLMEPGISGYVMGVIKTKDVNGCERPIDDNKHAVILQSISSSGVYSYYDPSSGEYGSCTPCDVLYAGKLTGVKEKVLEGKKKK